MVIQFLIFIKGAINIDIRQYGYHRNSNDDTYIALRDIDTGEYILNGDFVMSMFRKTIQYGGTTLEYSVCLSLLVILLFLFYASETFCFILKKEWDPISYCSEQDWSIDRRSTQSTKMTRKQRKQNGHG